MIFSIEDTFPGFHSLTMSGFHSLTMRAKMSLSILPTVAAHATVVPLPPTSISVVACTVSKSYKTSEESYHANAALVMYPNLHYPDNRSLFTHWDCTDGHFVLVLCRCTRAKLLAIYFLVLFAF